MAWASGFGKGGSFPAALERAAGEAREKLGERPDFLLFFSTRPLPGRDTPCPRTAPLQAGARVHQVLKPRTGWTGAPAVSVLAGSFPFPCLQVHRFRKSVFPSPDQPPRTWRRTLGIQGPPPSALLLLAGPASSHLAPLLPGLESAFPRTILAGAVLGPPGPPHEGKVLFLDHPLPAGEVLGFALDPPLSMEVRVVPAFEPLGPPRKVTALSGEELSSLDGRPAWEVLREETRRKDIPPDQPLLAQVSSLPPGPGEELPCGTARTVLRVGRRVRVLTPGGLRVGQWIRFCRPSPERTRMRISALPDPDGKGPGATILFACPQPGNPPSPDPAQEILARLEETPLLGARSWAQIAAPPGCGPLLLGQTLVFCRIGEAELPSAGDSLPETGPRK